jgi:hypothetical protein
MSFNYFRREAQEQKMGLFSKSKTTKPPQVTPIARADKKIILNFGAKAPATAREMAAATLEAGGFDPAIAEPKPPQVGDKMPDGTIYAGLSPDTGKSMYAMAEDAPQRMEWKEAKKYVKKLDALGHKDWRLPTQGELSVVFNNRAAIGGFDVSGSFPAGWYWSGTQDSKWTAWGQRFSDGFQYCNFENGKTNRISVRCVR